MCLISEGQLEAFLQNVIRQAQASAEIRYLSQQLGSVLFQSGGESLFLCFMVVTGDLVWSIYAMLHRDQCNPIGVLQWHHTFKMKSAEVFFP